MEDAFCRDVPPDQLAGVAGALDEWLGAANGVLAGIEQRIDWTLDATAAAEQARSEAEKALERERKSIRTTIELQVGHGGHGWPCGHSVVGAAAAPLLSSCCLLDSSSLSGPCWARFCC